MDTSMIPHPEGCQYCDQPHHTFCDGCGRKICPRHTFMVPSPFDGGVEEEYCPNCIRRRDMP